MPETDEELLRRLRQVTEKLEAGAGDREALKARLIGRANLAAEEAADRSDPES